jgi:hypothetical protein
MYNNSDFAIVLPNQFATPSEVLQSAANRKERQQERLAAQAERDRNFNERQREFDERQKDRDTADEYRKIQMINEYTDLSKHPSGSDVANEVAGNIIKSQMPQYLDMAKKGASYSDLYGTINKGMNGISTALDGIKGELSQQDAAVKMLKDRFGNSVDTDSILKIARADVINRRLDNNHNFVNPLSVQPSEFTPKLSDPRYLSQFVKSDTNLANEIINPKGLDQISVPTGTADAHNIYDARVPYWKQPNFTQEQKQKGGGFLPQGFVPQLVTKSETIPLDKLPKEINENKPFVVADKGVYDKFAENPTTNIELIAKTRKAYPDYDKFTDLEKEYAERHTLYNTIESLDRSNFQYKSTVKPARTTNNINVGGSKEVTIKDVYSTLKSKLSQKKGGMPMNELTGTEQDAVLKHARNVTNETELSNKDIALFKDGDNIAIYKIDTDTDGKQTKGQLVSVLDNYDVNSKVNKSAKDLEKLKKDDLNASKVGNTYDVGGKKMSHDDLKKMGYTDTQIDQAIQLGNIKKHK